MPKSDKTASETLASPTVSEEAVAVSQSPTEICRAVERVMTKEPRDRVRCTHLFGDYYRCNWWSRVASPNVTEDYDWASTLTDHIRQSRFLQVTVGPAGVEVRAVTARAGGGVTAD